MLKILVIFGILVLGLRAQVAVVCANCPLPKSLKWTPWFDRDNPSATGDYETLAELIKEGKKICPVPVGVECQTTAGRPAYSTG